MILCLANVLPPQRVAEVLRLLSGAAPFVDGAQTAGAVARKVKNNLQIDGTEPRFLELRKQLTMELVKNPMFERATMVRKINPVILSRYDPGMAYGTHTDNPIMDGVRTDVSFTLFLGDPSTYEGGELVIESTIGDQAVKLPAGAAVVYPSGALHRVEPVRRGTRYAIVGWIQSFVRNPEHRQILFDLETVAQSLYERDGKSAEFDLITKTSANLMRQWAEP